jgi:hypothetical protein
VNNELERMWKGNQMSRSIFELVLLGPTCLLSSNKAKNNSIHLITVILHFWVVSLRSQFCFLQTSHNLFSCICLFMPVVFTPLPDPGISSPQPFFHAVAVLGILSPPVYTTRPYNWISIIQSVVCQDVL